MSIKTVVIKKTSAGLPKWMLLVDPQHESGTALILKGHYPQYIYEIVPPNDDPDCYKVSYYGRMHHIMLRKSIESDAAAADRYLLEMLAWYAGCGVRPTLQQIHSGRLARKSQEAQQ